MSSFSAKFIAPPFPSISSAARSSRPSKMFAATTPAAVEAVVDAERLEPRVEERAGYWVLKEKFRQGINPQEKVKLGKEPMTLFTENGIDDLAKLSMEQIDADKLSKEDIDVRLKWLGLFHRRKHQYKHLSVEYILSSWQENSTSHYKSEVFSTATEANPHSSPPYLNPHRLSSP